MKRTRRLKICLTLLTAGLAFSAGPEDRPSGLNGRWQTVANGPNAGIKILVSSTKMTFYESNFTVGFTIKTDSSKCPPWIDLKSIGEDSTEVIKGIFELNGDDLILAFSMSSRNRPANLSGPNVETFRLVRDGSITTGPSTTAEAATRKTGDDVATSQPPTTRR